MKLAEQNIDHWIALMDKIAEKEHSGQTRHDGKTPYIEHPRAVSAAVEKRLKPIALGHDLLEDTDVKVTYLRKLGFPSYIINAIVILTHKKNEPNIEYWNRILTNPDAVIVKIEDIRHNLSSNPSEHARQKYAKALQLFKQAGYSI